MHHHIPAIALGTYKISDYDVTDIVLSGLEMGYRHIDTAQIYKNESGIGRALLRTSLSREEIRITDKVWISNYSYQGCYNSVLASLHALQTDYIDLMLLHWPNTRIGHHAVFDALWTLQSQQKIRYFGVSNFPVIELQQAIDYCGQGHIYCNQIEIHPLFYPTICYQRCKQHGILVSAYSPFAHGKIFKEPTYSVLQNIACKYHASVSQIVLAWLHQKGVDILIPKSTKPKRFVEYLYYTKIVLEEEDIMIINDLPKDQRWCNPVFHPLWDD